LFQQALQHAYGRNRVACRIHPRCGY
jgi:hypothetical protein